MSLTLKTVAVRADGAFSVLLWDGVPFAVSVERTFEDGKPIIQNGVYACQRDYYHKGGYETFEVIVVGHDRILFHKGNLETHSMGCVIVAESFGQLNGVTAVLDSKSGFEELMALAKEKTQFNMTVEGRP